MKKCIKSLSIGVVIGGMLASSVTYASSSMTNIDVSVEPVQFKYNNETVESSDKSSVKRNVIFNGKEYVPASFIYKGTTYLPVRFFGEAVGKSVAWDAQAKAVVITDRSKKQEKGKQGSNKQGADKGRDKRTDEKANKKANEKANTSTEVEYTVVANGESGIVDRNNQEGNLPADVQEWVNKYSKQDYQGSMQVDGATYILIARGECASGGYNIEIRGVIETQGTLEVQAALINPSPTDFTTTAITYPVFLMKVDKAYADVSFDIQGGTTAKLR